MSVTTLETASGTSALETSTLETSVPAAVVPAVTLRTPGAVRATGLLPVMCTLAAESIKSCQVTATTLVDGQPVAVGRGHTSLDGRPAAQRVAVGVELTDLGRELARRDGGVTVVLDAVVQGAGTASYVVSEPHRVTFPR